MMKISPACKELDEKPGTDDVEPATKRKLFNGNGCETPKKKRRTKSSMQSPSMILPLTERQQLAYLLEMTAKEVQHNVADLHNGLKDSMQEENDKKKSSKHKSTKVNKRNERGEAPLHLMAIKGDVEGVTNLIEQGADVNVKDYAGWTPLHEACNQGHYKIVKVLLRAGACVHVRGLEDDTPLHDASSNAHSKIVKLLLKFGADPLQKNQQSKTAIDLASSPDISQILQNQCNNDMSAGNKENQETAKRTTSESSISTEPECEDDIDSNKDINYGDQMPNEAEDITENNGSINDVHSKNSSDIIPSPTEEHLPEDLKDQPAQTNYIENSATESTENLCDGIEDSTVEESEPYENVDELSQISAPVEDSKGSTENEEIDYKLSVKEIDSNIDDESSSFFEDNENKSSLSGVAFNKEEHFKEKHLAEIPECSDSVSTVKSPVSQNLAEMSIFEDILPSVDIPSPVQCTPIENKETESNFDHLKTYELFEDCTKDDASDIVESFHQSESISVSVQFGLLDIISKQNSTIDCCDLNICDDVSNDSQLSNSLNNAHVKFSSELSDEDKQIVDITMEIEESLSRGSENYNSINGEHSSDLNSNANSNQSSESDIPKDLTSNCVSQESLKTEIPIIQSSKGLKIQTESTETPMMSLDTKNQMDCDLIVSDQKNIDNSLEKCDCKLIMGRTNGMHVKSNSQKYHTVDLEPRDLVGAVLNVDIDTACAHIPSRLSPILEHPWEHNSESFEKTNSGVNPTEVPEEHKIPETTDTESQDEKTAAKSSMRLRSQKAARSLSPTLPTRWREAVRRYCQTAELNTFPEDYVDFLVVSKKYSTCNNEIQIGQISQLTKPMKSLASKQRVELERLHLCMEQDLLRIESKYKLISNNKEAVSACNVMMYQKEELCKKLRKFLKNQTKLSVSDPDKLRKAWMQDIIDKYCNLEESMLVRHGYERQTIEAERIASRNMDVDRKNYLRTKYLPLIRKRIKADR